MIRSFGLLFIALSFVSPLMSQEEPLVDTMVFTKVEVEADYPGGIPAWRNFLEKNLNPSVPVDNGAPAGRYTVYVQFIVGRDGKISEIKPLTREGYGMEQEVIRIMRTCGSWTPAIQFGKPVKAYRKQPVTFLVSEEGFDIRTETPYTLFTETDNKLAIELERVKPDDLDVSISHGSIRYDANGQFIARVTKPGRVLITVLNRKKKKAKPSVMSLEVRKKAS